MASDLLQLAWNQLWQVTLLIVVVAILVRLFARNRPQLAHLLWMLVLLKCLTPPLWSSQFGLFSWMQPGMTLPSVSVADEAEPGTTVPPPVEDQPRSAALDLDSPPSGDSERRISVSIGPAVSRVTDLEASPARNVLDVEPVRSGNAQSRRSSESPDAPRAQRLFTSGESGDLRWKLSGISMAIAWCTGMLIVIAVAARQWIRYRSHIRRVAAPADVRIVDMAEQLAKRLGMWVTPRVLVVQDEAISPAVIGFWAPTVLLPGSILDDMPRAKLEPILAHELIHARRLDAWAGLLQIAAQAVWWFHPLVWRVGKRLLHEADRCCDEAVVAELGCAPSHYADCLLDVIELRMDAEAVSFPPVPGLGSAEGTAQRLERIMKLRKGCRKRTPWWCWMTVFALAAVVLPGAAMVANDRENSTQPPEETEEKQMPASVEEAPEDKNESPGDTVPSGSCLEEHIMYHLPDENGVIWTGERLGSPIKRRIYLPAIDLDNVLPWQGHFETVIEYVERDDPRRTPSGIYLVDQPAEENAPRVQQRFGVYSVLSQILKAHANDHSPYESYLHRGIPDRKGDDTRWDMHAHCIAILFDEFDMKPFHPKGDVEAWFEDDQLVVSAEQRDAEKVRQAVSLMLQSATSYFASGSSLPSFHHIDNWWDELVKAPWVNMSFEADELLAAIMRAGTDKTVPDELRSPLAKDGPISRLEAEGHLVTVCSDVLNRVCSPHLELRANINGDGEPKLLYMHCSDGKLHLSAPEPCREIIERALKSMRTGEEIQHSVEVRFVTLSDEDMKSTLGTRRWAALPLPTEHRDRILQRDRVGGQTLAEPPSTAVVSVESRGSRLGMYLSEEEAHQLLTTVHESPDSNYLQAPKITIFDGQEACVSDTTMTPFVVDVVPIVGEFATAYQPVIEVVHEGLEIHLNPQVDQNGSVQLDFDAAIRCITEVEEHDYLGVKEMLDRHAPEGEDVDVEYSSPTIEEEITTKLQREAGALGRRMTVSDYAGMASDLADGITGCLIDLVLDVPPPYKPEEDGIGGEQGVGSFAEPYNGCVVQVPIVQTTRIASTVNIPKGKSLLLNMPPAPGESKTPHRVAIISTDVLRTDFWENLPSDWPADSPSEAASVEPTLR